MSVSNSPVEDDPEVSAKPRRSRLKGGPIKPGQYLLNRVQVKELCGDPSDSTLWGWMMHAGFPHPVEMGPPGGRTTKVCWIASEVFAWLEARPRRAIGHLKQVRAAQETGKDAGPKGRPPRIAKSVKGRSR